MGNEDVQVPFRRQGLERGDSTLPLNIGVYRGMFRKKGFGSCKFPALISRR